MLHRIIGFSIENKLIIGLFVIALIGWGTYEVTRLPIDAVPDITDNQIQVITVSPALGATDVERLITFPIEQSCSNIPGLTKIRSFSRFGLSLVTVVFDDDIDIYWARQQISERLLQIRAAIPEGIGSPEMAPVTTGLGEIYQYVVRPKRGYEHRYDAMELRTIQDWTIRRQLLGTPGVADVSSFGGRLKQYEIAVRTETLKGFGLTIADIFDALERNNENTGGAYIEKGPTVLYIRTEGLTKGVADIQKIVVKKLSDGTPVLMKDVASVGLGYATRYGAMTFNGEGEVAGAVVMMLKGENSSAVIRNVKNKIAEIQKSLPEGVVIEPFLDRTKMVNNAINTVKTNLIEGALIVVFVLVFFLGNLRAGLIVSSVIPLSMLFAIILMNKFGVGGNLMSLGAIDFGLIVDGSVIVVEAILHRFQHSKQFARVGLLNQAQMDQEVGHSTGTMIKSAVFSQIIILIVYIPILSLEGIEGKMFKPMAFTVGFAILGAFILSVTYVPMVSALLLSKKITHSKSLADRMMAWLERGYQPLLQYVLGMPKTALLVTLLTFILSAVVLTKMGGEFIPELEEGDFAVETRLLTGSSLTNTINTTEKTAKILVDRFPEVEKVVTKIGSSEIPVDPMPLEASDMMVILKPKDEWVSASSFDELAEKMTKELRDVPGVSVGFQFPVQMRFNELMTGARQDVVCKIFGEDLDTLAHYSQMLGRLVSGVDGAEDLYVEKVTGMPQVVVTYDRDAMAMYGLSVRDVNNTVNAAFAGQSAGVVYEGEKRFDLVVRLEQGSRNSVSDIENLLIPVDAHNQVPLSQVARIEEIVGPNQIQRENTRRRIIIGFNVVGRDVQSIVEELKRKVDAELDLPLGYTITYGGAFENLNAAKERLSVVVPVALILIFLLLYFAFGSVKLGLLIYSAIPLSAMGGIFSLWMRDMPFSISAGVGFIALFGVAVLNGILLVSEFTRLKKEGWHDTSRIIVHATKSKLRAILMTALVPSLGFIPMAISRGAGAEVQKPLATVVIGGLIISTLLTLFVLPVIYNIAAGRAVKVQPRLAMLLVFGLVIGGSFSARAQHPVSLDQALEIGLKNNADLQVSQLNQEYFEKLQKTSFDPGLTHAVFDFGQMNSVANDTKFGITQSIQFPSVYMNQSRINKSSVEISGLQFRKDISALKSEIKTRFYELAILEERVKLLHTADSIYDEFRKKTERRLALGDADVLESATARSQQTQARNQINRILAESDVKLREFQLLLGVDTLLTVRVENLVYPIIISDTTLANSPSLQLQSAILNQRQLAVKLEQSKLLPELTFGYNSLSLIGFQRVGDTEQYFNKSDRFTYWSVGLGMPIFNRAQRGRIQAARVQMQMQQVATSFSQRKARSALKNQIELFTEAARQVASYERSLQATSDVILNTALRRLDRGEIGYLEWVMLVNQSIDIKARHLDAIQRQNEIAFGIEELQGK